MNVADRIAREELAALSAQGLLRSLETQTSRPGAEIALASGERLINFSSNDSLGLAGHPVVGKALE
ncbi:MAG: 8-amino-7-oxononanoate synthase, partial [Myxococcales bacterium]